MIASIQFVVSLTCMWFFLAHGAILLPEGNYGYNGRHIPGYKDIVQIQYGTEEHVPHYENYYGNLRRSENGRSQRSANPRNNVNYENYDAALDRVLNLLMSSFGAILLPEGNYGYNGRHIPGYKDIVQIQYGTEEHVPHYENYYGNLRRSENDRSQRSANSRNNVNIHFGRQIYTQNENYDAALDRVLNLLMSSFGKEQVGSASYRKVDTLKGRNAEFGFDNGNRINIGINSKAQISRNRKRYTDAHRSRAESDYKTSNVYTNGNRFDGQQVNDYKGRNGQGFGRNDNKREYLNGLIHQRGNDYKGRQVLVSIRKEYRNRDGYNGESGIDYRNQNLHRGEGHRRYDLEESKYGPETAYRNFRENPSVNYKTYVGGKGNQYGIESAFGNIGQIFRKK